MVLTKDGKPTPNPPRAVRSAAVSDGSKSIGNWEMVEDIKPQDTVVPEAKAESKTTTATVSADTTPKLKGFTLLTHLVKNYYPCSKTQQLLPVNHPLWPCIDVLCDYFVARVNYWYGEQQFFLKQLGVFESNPVTFRQLVCFIDALANMRSVFHDQVRNWFCALPEINHISNTYVSSVPTYYVPLALGLEAIMMKIPPFIGGITTFIPSAWRDMSTDEWKHGIVAEAKRATDANKPDFTNLPGRQEGIVRAGQFVSFETDKYWKWGAELQMAQFPVEEKELGALQLPRLYQLIRYWKPSFGRSAIAHHWENEDLLKNVDELMALDFLSNYLLDQRSLVTAGTVLANGVHASDMVSIAREMFHYVSVSRGRRDGDSLIQKGMTIMEKTNEWSEAKPALDAWFLKTIDAIRRRAPDKVNHIPTAENALLAVAWLLLVGLVVALGLAARDAKSATRTMDDLIARNAEYRMLEKRFAELETRTKHYPEREAQLTTHLDAMTGNMQSWRSKYDELSVRFVKVFAQRNTAVQGMEMSEVMRLIEGLKQNVTEAFRARDDGMKEAGVAEAKRADGTAADPSGFYNVITYQAAVDTSCTGGRCNEHKPGIAYPPIVQPMIIGTGGTGRT